MLLLNKTMNYPHRQTFTHELLNTYDNKGKEVAKSYVVAAGWKVVDETEAYGSHDFIIEDGKGKQMKVEVEVKNSWSRIDFPFVTHHVSHRKSTSKADLFIQVNRPGTAIAVCSMKYVQKCPITHKSCVLPDGQRTEDEPFFTVPSCRMHYFFKDDAGQWRQKE